MERWFMKASNRQLLWNIGNGAHVIEVHSANGDRESYGSSSTSNLRPRICLLTGATVSGSVGLRPQLPIPRAGDT